MGRTSGWPYHEHYIEDHNVDLKNFYTCYFPIDGAYGLSVVAEDFTNNQTLVEYNANNNNSDGY